MKGIMLIHPYFLWPSLGVMALISGIMSAGYKDIAISAAEARAEINTIIEYVPSEQQLKVISEIKI